MRQKVALRILIRKVIFLWNEMDEEVYFFAKCEMLVKELTDWLKHYVSAPLFYKMGQLWGRAYKNETAFNCALSLFCMVCVTWMYTSFVIGLPFECPSLLEIVS